ncbi:MAG: hypothetical protein AABW73_01940 [Nanoarchaeota archaeon]
MDHTRTHDPQERYSFQGMREGNSPPGHERHYDDSVRSNTSSHGGHSMRVTLADKIVAGGSDFYCPRVKRNGTWYRRPKSSQLRRDHESTLRGQEKSGNLNVYQALNIIGYTGWKPSKRKVKGNTDEDQEMSAHQPLY